jgi:hypothetical protein
MSAPQYSVIPAAAISLGAATAVSAISVLAPSQFGLEISGFDLGFLGVTATDVPVLAEWCKWDGAGAGTSTGAATVTQENGLTITPGFTAFYDYTAEPTALVPFRRFSLTPNGGTVLFDMPLGKEIQCAASAGLVLRLTAPQAQSAWVTLRVNRI